MAYLARYVTSNSNWVNHDLLSFNIHVVNASTTVFFNTLNNGTPEVPPTTVSATILNNIDKPDGPLAKNDRLFFQYMGMAEDPRSTESFANDFAAFILHLLNYDNEDRVICQRTELSFPMGRQRIKIGIDVCLMNGLEHFLVVQKHKVSC